MGIHIININSELGAGTRGASLGFGALRVAAWNRQHTYFKDHKITTLKDENHRMLDRVDTPFAKHIVGIYNVFNRVAEKTKRTVQDGDFPLVLAGDHSTASATISGLKMAYPEKRIGVVWVDAHADLHSPYSSPSGNMHGMPLAIVTAEDNAAHQLNKVNRKTSRYWYRMQYWGGMAPKVNPSDIVFFGVRDTEPPEDHLLEHYGIRNYPVAEVRYRGVDTCVQEALKQLDGCDLIYLSFDVDSMDSDLVSHGTGTPVSLGFTPEEAFEVLQGLIQSGKVGCFEMVEVNPTLDERKNRMAETAFEILDRTTELIQSKLS